MILIRFSNEFSSHTFLLSPEKLFQQLTRRLCWWLMWTRWCDAAKASMYIKILCTLLMKNMKRIRCALDNFPLTNTHRRSFFARSLMSPPTQSHYCRRRCRCRLPFSKLYISIALFSQTNTHNRYSTQHLIACFFIRHKRSAMVHEVTVKISPYSTSQM